MNEDVFDFNEINETAHAVEELIDSVPETVATESDFINNLEKLKGDLSKILSTIDPADPMQYIAGVAKPNRMTKADDVIMGDPTSPEVMERNGKRGRKSTFISNDESFSKVIAPSIEDKMKKRLDSSKYNLLTEEDLKNKLKGITHIRSIWDSTITITSPGISSVKVDDLIETDKDGVYFVMSEKVINQTSTGIGIPFPPKDSLCSVVKLHPSLRIRLCNSEDFVEFVKRGLIAISSEEESDAIDQAYREEEARRIEERKKKELSDGTLVGTEQVLQYALDNIDRKNLTPQYLEEVAKIESMKVEEATFTEKLRIASNILVSRQAEAFDKVNKKTCLQESADLRAPSLPNQSENDKQV